MPGEGGGLWIASFCGEIVNDEGANGRALATARSRV